MLIGKESIEAAAAVDSVIRFNGCRLQNHRSKSLTLAVSQLYGKSQGRQDSDNGRSKRNNNGKHFTLVEFSETCCCRIFDIKHSTIVRSGDYSGKWFSLQTTRRPDKAFRLE